MPTERKISEGITEITFTQTEKDEMETRIAKSHGLSLEQYRAAIAKDFADHWCQCKNEEPGIGHFCDDGERINEHCCQKHHYHCDACGKIVQVG